MGLNITCDCCQNQTDNVTEVGYVGKAYYCPECLPKYEDYKRQIDSFHNEVALAVQVGLKKIKDDWLLSNPEATLPE